MALNKGDSACTTGLSKRIYDYLVADRARGVFSGTPTSVEQDFQRWIAWAVAQAVVDEITANGVSRIVIAQAGLQQFNTADPAGLRDTYGPSSSRTIDGTVL